MATNEVPVGTVMDISCEEARARAAQPGIDPDELLTLQLVTNRCAVEAYNEKHKDDPLPDKKIGYSTPDPKDPRKVLFGIMTVREAQTGNALCKMAAGGFIGAAAPDLPTELLTAFGNYSCDSYYEAAVKNDPMLIAFPALVPGQRFTKEILQRSMAVGTSLAAHFKERPEDILTFGINPTAQADLLVTIGKSMGGDGGKILAGIGEAAGGAARELGKSAGQVAQEAAEEAERLRQEAEKILKELDPTQWKL